MTIDRGDRDNYHRLANSENSEKMGRMLKTTSSGTKYVSFAHEGVSVRINFTPAGQVRWFVKSEGKEYVPITQFKIQHASTDDGPGEIVDELENCLQDALNACGTEIAPEDFQKCFKTNVLSIGLRLNSVVQETFSQLATSPKSPMTLIGQYKEKTPLSPSDIHLEGISHLASTESSPLLRSPSGESANTAATGADTTGTASTRAPSTTLDESLSSIEGNSFQTVDRFNRGELKSYEVKRVSVITNDEIQTRQDFDFSAEGRDYQSLKDSWEELLEPRIPVITEHSRLSTFSPLPSSPGAVFMEAQSPKIPLATSSPTSSPTSSFTGTPVHNAVSQATRVASAAPMQITEMQRRINAQRTRLENLSALVNQYENQIDTCKIGEAGRIKAYLEEQNTELNRSGETSLDAIEGDLKIEAIEYLLSPEPSWQDSQGNSPLRIKKLCEAIKGFSALQQGVNDATERLGEFSPALQAQGASLLETSNVLEELATALQTELIASGSAQQRNKIMPLLEKYQALKKNLSAFRWKVLAEKALMANKAGERQRAFTTQVLLSAVRNLRLRNGGSAKHLHNSLSSTLSQPDFSRAEGFDERVSEARGNINQLYTLREAELKEDFTALSDKVQKWPDILDFKGPLQRELDEHKGELDEHKGHITPFTLPENLERSCEQVVQTCNQEVEAYVRCEQWVNLGERYTGLQDQSLNVNLEGMKISGLPSEFKDLQNQYNQRLSDVEGLKEGINTAFSQVQVIFKNYHNQDTETAKRNLDDLESKISSLQTSYNELLDTKRQLEKAVDLFTRLSRLAYAPEVSQRVPGGFIQSLQAELSSQICGTERLEQIENHIACIEKIEGTGQTLEQLCGNMRTEIAQAHEVFTRAADLGFIDSKNVNAFNEEETSRIDHVLQDLQNELKTLLTDSTATQENIQEKFNTSIARLRWGQIALNIRENSLRDKITSTARKKLREQYPSVADLDKAKRYTQAQHLLTDFSTFQADCQSIEAGSLFDAAKKSKERFAALLDFCEKAEAKKGDCQLYRNFLDRTNHLLNDSQLLGRQGAIDLYKGTSVTGKSLADKAAELKGLITTLETSIQTFTGSSSIDTLEFNKLDPTNLQTVTDTLRAFAKNCNDFRVAEDSNIENLSQGHPVTQISIPAGSGAEDLRQLITNTKAFLDQLKKLSSHAQELYTDSSLEDYCNRHTDAEGFKGLCATDISELEQKFQACEQFARIVRAVDAFVDKAQVNSRYSFSKIKRSAQDVQKAAQRHEKLIVSTRESLGKSKENVQTLKELASFLPSEALSEFHEKAQSYERLAEAIDVNLNSSEDINDADLKRQTTRLKDSEAELARSLHRAIDEFTSGTSSQLGALKEPLGKLSQDGENLCSKLEGQKNALRAKLFAPGKKSRGRGHHDLQPLNIRPFEKLQAASEEIRKFFTSYAVLQPISEHGSSFSASRATAQSLGQKIGEYSKSWQRREYENELAQVQEKERELIEAINIQAKTSSTEEATLWNLCETAPANSAGFQSAKSQATGISSNFGVLCEDFKKKVTSLRAKLDAVKEKTFRLEKQIVNLKILLRNLGEPEEPVKQIQERASAKCQECITAALDEGKEFPSDLLDRVNIVIPLVQELSSLNTAIAKLPELLDKESLSQLKADLESLCIKINLDGAIEQEGAWKAKITELKASFEQLQQNHSSVISTDALRLDEDDLESVSGDSDDESTVVGEDLIQTCQTNLDELRASFSRESSSSAGSSLGRAPGSGSGSAAQERVSPSLFSPPTSVRHSPQSLSEEGLAEPIEMTEEISDRPLDIDEIHAKINADLDKLAGAGPDSADESLKASVQHLKNFFTEGDNPLKRKLLDRDVRSSYEGIARDFQSRLADLAQKENITSQHLSGALKSFFTFVFANVQDLPLGDLDKRQAFFDSLDLKDLQILSELYATGGRSFVNEAVFSILTRDSKSWTELESRLIHAKVLQKLDTLLEQRDSSPIDRDTTARFVHELANIRALMGDQEKCKEAFSEADHLQEVYRDLDLGLNRLLQRTYHTDSNSHSLEAYGQALSLFIGVLDKIASKKAWSSRDPRAREFFAHLSMADLSLLCRQYPHEGKELTKVLVDCFFPKEESRSFTKLKSRYDKAKKDYTAAQIAQLVQGLAQSKQKVQMSISDALKRANLRDPSLGATGLSVIQDILPRRESTPQDVTAKIEDIQTKLSSLPLQIESHKLQETQKQVQETLSALLADGWDTTIESYLPILEKGFPQNIFTKQAKEIRTLQSEIKELIPNLRGQLASSLEEEKLRTILQECHAYCEKIERLQAMAAAGQATEGLYKTESKILEEIIEKFEVAPRPTTCTILSHACKVIFSNTHDISGMHELRCFAQLTHYQPNGVEAALKHLLMIGIQDLYDRAPSPKGDRTEFIKALYLEAGYELGLYSGSIGAERLQVIDTEVSLLLNSMKDPLSLSIKLQGAASCEEQPFTGELTEKQESFQELAKEFKVISQHHRRKLEGDKPESGYYLSLRADSKKKCDELVNTFGEGALEEANRIEEGDLRYQVVNEVLLRKILQAGTDDSLKEIEEHLKKLATIFAEKQRYPVDFSLFAVVAAQRIAHEIQEKGLEDALKKEIKDLCPIFTLPGLESDPNFDPQAMFATKIAEAAVHMFDTEKSSKVIKVMQNFVKMKEEAAEDATILKFAPSAPSSTIQTQLLQMTSEENYLKILQQHARLHVTRAKTMGVTLDYFSELAQAATSSEKATTTPEVPPELPTETWAKRVEPRTFTREKQKPFIKAGPTSFPASGGTGALGGGNTSSRRPLFHPAQQGIGSRRFSTISSSTGNLHGARPPGQLAQRPQTAPHTRREIILDQAFRNRLFSKIPGFVQRIGK